MKINTSVIKKNLGFLPRVIAEKPLPSYLVLVLIGAVLGGVLFYKFVILAEKAEIKTGGKPIQINQSLYQGVLEGWEKREKIFKEAESKTHPDIFNPLAITETPEG